jgi:hypothetical protein
MKRKKIAILCSTIGSNIVELLIDLCSPETPDNKSYQELCEIISKHFQPKQSIIAERCKLHRMVQGENQLIAEYVVSLRAQAKFCNFKADQLNEQLRDIFVVGLNSERVKTRLYTEDSEDLTFEKAIQIAQGQELAEKNIKATAIFEKAEIFSDSINQAKLSNLCYTCGKKGHNRTDCRYKDAKCYTCGKQGHIASVCRAKLQNSKRTNQRLHGVVETEKNIIDINNVDAEEVSHQKGTITLEINGKPIVFELDTSAAVTVIPYDIAKTLQLKLRSSSRNFTSATGHSFHLVGYASVKY